MQINVMYLRAKVILTFWLILTIFGCAEIPKKENVHTNKFEKLTKTKGALNALAIRQSAYSIGERAKIWQLNQLDNYDYIPESYQTDPSEPKLLIQVPFYIGLIRWAEATFDQALFDNLERMGNAQNYRLLHKRIMDADDHIIGQTYLWLAEQTGNKVEITSAQREFASLPLIIDDVPQEHLSKKRYIELYSKYAESFIALQNENGFWPISLEDLHKVKTPDVNGTGLITFALAWGVNNGILNGEKYISAVEKSWSALIDVHDKDGRINKEKKLAQSPYSMEKEDIEFYGFSTVLLAASEMTKWKSKDPQIKAYARYVPERQDDFAWENDKVAFRVYGPAAQMKGHSSGVDAWLKKVDYSIIDKWYRGFIKGVSYHIDKGEGYDPYHTGTSRGVGGSAVWVDGIAYAAHNYLNFNIIKSGDEEVVFNLTYEWPTPLGLVAESKTISLALGEQLYHVNSIFTLNGQPADIPIAIGLTTHNEKAKVSFNKDRGRVSAWEVIDNLGLGTGVLVDPKIITDIKHIASEKKDTSHIWIFTKSDEQGKLAYRAGFAWEGAGDITNRESWLVYLDTIK